MIPQITSIKVIHNEIEVLSILKTIDHIDKKRMTQFWEMFSLIQYWSNWFFVYDFSFTHQFHSIDLFVSFVLHFPYLTKTTFSNSHYFSKIVFGNLLMVVVVMMVNVVIEVDHKSFSFFGVHLFAHNVIVFYLPLGLWYLM